MVSDFPNSTDRMRLRLPFIYWAFRPAIVGKGLEMKDSFKWKGVFRRSVPNGKKSSTSEGAFFDFNPKFPDFLAKW